MLFQKFVFVLYILFCYAWFLLGTLYETEYRFVPIISMITSLSSICIITLFQLQSIFDRHRLNDNEKWSTISWSVLHIFISILFIADGMQWANIFVIFCIAGLTMTLVIFIVGTCSCHVIINNGKTWYPHVHLTCVAFWTLVQYMALRTPESVVNTITTIPIVCMAITRLIEHFEDDIDTKIKKYGELILWIVCIVFHIMRDMDTIEREIFYWGIALFIFLMCLFSTYVKQLFLVVILPLLLIPFSLYICIVKILNGKVDHAITEIAKLYKDIIEQDDNLVILPFDEEFSEKDWEEKL